MLQSLKKFVPFAFTPKPNIITKMDNEIKIIRKPRYDGRIKKRKWEERRSDHGESLDPTKAVKVVKKNSNNTETEITSEIIDKIKRRKFVLLLGYSGTDYYGMQRNPQTRTIEEDLLKSLLDNKYVSEENFAQVQTMQFQRAARTDKGVSAARQVVSLKLPESIEIEKINEHLPLAIRVFTAKRVTKGFNAKVQCDGRSYFYLLPTVVFVPADQMMVQKGYRIQQEILDKVARVLKKFEGTKNFHNFTSKKKAADPSAKRFMKTLAIEEPFVKDDVEFTVIRIRGQSFMLHQIRKMVGLCIAVVKGYTAEETLDMAFGAEKVNIPRAPGLGLVLDYVHYDRYNNRYGADGIHDKLIFDEVESKVNEFKETYIYPIILDTEIREEEMMQWVISKLSGHTYDGAEEEDDNDKSDEEERSPIRLGAT